LVLAGVGGALTLAAMERNRTAYWPASQTRFEPDDGRGHGAAIMILPIDEGA
jgi:hypothetical protein